MARKVFNRKGLCFVATLIAVVSRLATGSYAQTPTPGVAEPAVRAQQSMADVSKQLNNPVADVWALNFQFNRYYLQGEATDRTREQDVINFQPVLPIHLTRDWNLIIHPEVGAFPGLQVLEGRRQGCGFFNDAFCRCGAGFGQGRLDQAALGTGRRSRGR